MICPVYDRGGECARLEEQPGIPLFPASSLAESESGGGGLSPAHNLINRVAASPKAETVGQDYNT